MTTPGAFHADLRKLAEKKQSSDASKKSLIEQALNSVPSVNSGPNVQQQTLFGHLTTSSTDKLIEIMNQLQNHVTKCNQELKDEIKCLLALPKLVDQLVSTNSSLQAQITSLTSKVEQLSNEVKNNSHPITETPDFFSAIDATVQQYESTKANSVQTSLPSAPSPKPAPTPVSSQPPIVKETIVTPVPATPPKAVSVSETPKKLNHKSKTESNLDAEMEDLEIQHIIHENVPNDLESTSTNESQNTYSLTEVLKGVPYRINPRHGMGHRTMSIGDVSTGKNFQSHCIKPSDGSEGSEVNDVCQACFNHYSAMVNIYNKVEGCSMPKKKVNCLRTPASIFSAKKKKTEDPKIRLSIPTELPSSSKTTPLVKDSKMEVDPPEKKRKAEVVEIQDDDTPTPPPPKKQKETETQTKQPKEFEKKTELPKRVFDVKKNTELCERFKAFRPFCSIYTEENTDKHYLSIPHLFWIDDHIEIEEKALTRFANLGGLIDEIPVGRSKNQRDPSKPFTYLLFPLDKINDFFIRCIDDDFRQNLENVKTRIQGQPPAERKNAHLLTLSPESFWRALAKYVNENKKK